MSRRRWTHRHPEGFDSDIDDFTPTYGYSDSFEGMFLVAAINGFSCGYPQCCVIAFLNKMWKFTRTQNEKDFRSKHHGITVTGQGYAKCGGRHCTICQKGMEDWLLGDYCSMACCVEKNPYIGV